MERTQQGNNLNSNNNLGNGINGSTSQFLRGWSWGEINIKNNRIEFDAVNQKWFSIPYASISNALCPTKNEIGLEFNIDEEDSRYEYKN
jgi:hypothetical protein